MALQQKLTAKTNGFVPSVPKSLQDSKVRKGERWDNFIEWIQNIPWAKLNADEFQSQWGQCLNAIHTAEAEGLVDRGDIWPYFAKYLKLKGYTPEQRVKLRSASESELTFSIVSKAYLLMIGNVDNKECVKTDAWITAKLKAILAKAPPPTSPETPDRRRTMTDRKRDKCSELMGDLQGLEDEHGEVDVLEFFKERNIPKEYLSCIVERFRPRLEELNEVLKTKDEQLKEAYRCYSRKDLKGMIAWYETLLAACDSYASVRVSTRAPRKQRVARAKPAEKVVARLKYLKHDEALNITSVDPKKLVGCNQVWLYNTRYRKLAVYHALEGQTLTVKGTTLLGWDPKTSHQKTLRWPAEQLTEFMRTTGRVALRQLMAGLKTTQQPMRGRVTEDVLILKVL